MDNYTHQTAPTQFVEANGIRFAYRRFGKAGGVPLVFNMHFIGTMDHWDPAVTDGLASEPRSDPVQQRRRLQQLRRGSDLGRGDGRQRDRLHQSAWSEAGGRTWLFDRRHGRAGDHAAGARLVRRLVLVGTGPRGGQGMAYADTGRHNGSSAPPMSRPDDLWLAVHFTPSEASQAAGTQFLKRFRLRTEDRDPEVTEKVAPAQHRRQSAIGALSANTPRII